MLKQSKDLGSTSIYEFKKLEKIFAGTSKKNVKDFYKQMDHLTIYMNHYRGIIRSQCGQLFTELSHIIRKGELEAANEIKTIKKQIEYYLFFLKKHSKTN